MAFTGVYIRLPSEAIDLLDTLAPYVGPVPPGQQGRTSVILRLLEDSDLADTHSDVREARKELRKLLSPGKLAK